MAKGLTGPDLESKQLSTPGTLVHTDERFAEAACIEVLAPTGAEMLAGHLAGVRAT